MKKLFNLVVMLCMISFASNSLFAQNEKVVADEQIQATDTSFVSEQVVAMVPEETLESESKVLTTSDLESIVALLNNTTGGKKQNILGTDSSVSVPLYKHRKIDGHHLCQRLELSIMGDKSETSRDLANKLFGGALPGGESSDADEKFLDKMDSKTGGLAIGANFGYSLVFIPGYKKEGVDELELNRLGFGYSIGMISQFDREKNAGVTWDFLGKVGVETGFNKAIGVGFDFMFGGGKTSQTVVDFGALDEKDPDPDDLDVTMENLWCAKVGTQLWVRLNFLTKSINNFDTAIFTRFVYSIKPYSDEDELKRIENYCEIPVWQHEAFSFGFTMTYFF